VESLAGGRTLRYKLDVTRACDIAWTHNHPGLWHVLVGARGWRPDAHERWFGTLRSAAAARALM
jgi:hypothetical protein